MADTFVEVAGGGVPAWAWRCGDVHAHFTRRAGGVSRGAFASLNLGLYVGDEPDAVAANRERVRTALGLRDVRSALQVHGTDVAVEPVDGWGAAVPRTEADALVTGARGVGLAVMTADCAPVVLAARDGVAVVHAGWRGLVGGVVERALDALADAGGPVRAALGPCIGSCCFEVGEEVAAHFGEEHVRRPAGVSRPFVDMPGALAALLARCGVELDVLDVCTACDEGCFSHRRDAGLTGRQAVVAWRTAAPEPVLTADALAD